MSLSPILINNNTVKQPTTLHEYRINIQNDNETIDGSTQRNRVISQATPLGFKYAADLTWQDLNVSDFQNLLGYFSSGSGVVYSNPSSKYGVLTYSGLPTVSEPDVYVPGDSLLTTFAVTIRQI